MILIRTIRGVLATLLFIFNGIIFPIPVLLLASIAKILPLKSWRTRMEQRVQHTPWVWAYFNGFAMWVAGVKLPKVTLPQDLEEEKPYLVIANHQTWIDILMLYDVFNHKVPPLKFFMKKELLWMLPIAGLACKAMGYPFMERHTRDDIRKNPKLKGRDVETTRQACRKFMTFSSSLMNFAEGTRVTEKKRQRQQSPYKYLLKPKAGGVSIVLEEMHEHLAGVLDVTIAYNTDDIGFWNFVCGGFKSINIDVRILPITQDLIGDYNKDREFRPHLQNWLNTIWQEKDSRLQELHDSWQKKAS
jgi:1-acyl-sn-glycerol-3-phosphate acyltransferase